MNPTWNYQEIKEIIRNHYLTILEREPDQMGLEFYINKIKNDEIKMESIPEIFKSSPEYIQLQNRKQSIKTPSFILKEIDGHIIHLNQNDIVLLECFSNVKNYEEATTIAIKKLVKKGLNVINIGANIGYFTLLLARQVGPDGKVFAFEPSNETAELLKKNIDSNGYKNVEIIIKAVSNKTGKADLWTGGSSVHNFVSEMKTQNYPQLKKRQIEITTIDEFIKDKKMTIDFVIMDAEGSEEYILEGMQKTLQQNPHLDIITEYNPYTFVLAETSGESFLNLVEKLGFSILIIDDSDKKVKRVTKRQILEKIISPNLTNLYLTKKSKTVFDD